MMPTKLAVGVQKSLEALPQRSEELEGLYDPLSGWADAANERGLADHLQGIAVCEGKPKRFFLTTSARGGLILSGKITRDSDGNPQYVVDCQSAEVGGNHPGGIQSFGSYVVVPVYDTNSKTIPPSLQLWSFNDGTPNSLTGHPLNVNLEKNEPYCAGLAHHEQLGFVLAVGLHPKGRLVGLYRKDSGTLTDGGSFIHTCTIKTRKAHRNNISLCVDHNDQVCLLGFRLSGLYSSLGFGEDRVDVYELPDSYWQSENGSAKRRKSVRTFTRHLKCRPGGEQPSFRWGASARVAKGGLEIATCGYQIFRNNDQRWFEVDVFRS